MLKHSLFLFLLLFSICLESRSQEQKEIILKTNITEATVFIKGAQVSRKKSVDLLPGKTKIRFTSLSPYIDAKSIQMRVDNDVMVISVNHQTNYLDSLEMSIETKKIEKQFETLANRLAEERTNRDVIKDEINFLNENRKIGGTTNGVSLLSLKETTIYYSERMAALKKEDLDLAKKIQTLEREQTALLNEQQQLGTTKLTPIGEVVVEIESQKAVKANFELSYYVNNAGWYPTYDIRAVNINEPIELIYKANVVQNTKEDWKNIKLKVSSADPNLGNVAPVLKTYYLDYYIAAPRYTNQAGSNQATGIVREEGNNEPLIGVSVTIQGSTIGTITDIDGRFSLSLPQNGGMLEFSYLGFDKQAMLATNSFMNVYLKPDNQTLDEVVVVGYGTSNALEGQIAGLSFNKKDVKKSEIKIMAAAPLPTVQIENQTAVEFEIKIPYTIKSDNKNTVIEVDQYELPAAYEYYCIPKANKDVFLLANVIDWEKYNLLEGEANIFFENTYIGKTILDVRNVSDTLNISLGRDKNVMVSRDKVKEYNTKKFLGNKREDTRVWKISAKNNKRQAIALVILDQVPVSTTNEIEVNTENLSGGTLNNETGQVKWKLQLAPNDKKDIELFYKVKYPKDKILTVE